MIGAISIYGQNTSAGFSIRYADYDKAGTGMQYSVDLRSQLSEKLGWQTDVGTFRSSNSTQISVTTFDPFTNQEFTTISESRSTYAFLRSGISYKLFKAAGITAEGIIQVGLIKREPVPEVRGMAHGELFFSTRISDKIVVGIPVSYNFVFWDRDEIISVGASFRYHY